MSESSKPKPYYMLADKFLAGRAIQGDTAARKVLHDRRAVQRMCTETAKASSSRDYRCHLSEGGWLHFRKDRDRHGRVWMFLEIGDHTSLEAIKRQWKEIRTWRDLLLEWQGPSPFGMNRFFQQLHLDHRQGQSYAAIAERLNKRMGSGLEALLEQNCALRQAIESGNIQTAQDLTHWQHTTEDDTSELFFIQIILRDFGFAEGTINEWCLSALKKLMAGRNALAAGVFFTRDRVISKLRAWRTKNQSRLTTEYKAS